MSYTLNGSAIRRPSAMKVSNSTQVAQHRTLDGSISRDYFGDNKRMWTLTYDNVNSSDYAAIETIYNTYLSTATAMTWVIDEANYSVSATVHIDLIERGFGVKGTDYLSDFNLVLTEA